MGMILSEVKTKRALSEDSARGLVELYYLPVTTAER
jgi:hypothetical protein